MNINESINNLTNAIDLLQKKSSLSSDNKLRFPLGDSDIVDRVNNDFSNFLRKGEDRLYGKSLTSSSDNNGSLLMPNDTCISIYQKMGDILPLRTVAKNIKISTDSLEILFDDKAPDAGWSTETKYISDSGEASFRKIKIPTNEIFANIKITQKLLDDTNVNIYDWFVNNISNKIASVENKAFWYGDGNGKPKGILSYEQQEGKSEFGKFECFKMEESKQFTKVSEDIVINVVASLRREYLKNACWIVSRSAYAALQQIRDDLSARLLRTASNMLPTTILGYPVFIDDDLPEINSSDEAPAAIFGDFSSAYTIVDRTDINIFRDPYSSKPFVEFFATKRTGGDVVNFDALKVLKFKARN